MTLTIKYFGLIAEKTGTRKEIVRLKGEECDLKALKEHCFSKYELTNALSVQIAVNQSLGTSGPLKNGDEIAFLPPFAGG